MVSHLMLYNGQSAKLQPNNSADFKTLSFLRSSPLMFHTAAERLLGWLAHVPLQVQQRVCSTVGAPPNGGNHCVALTNSAR